jgi:hypothetical protein
MATQTPEEILSHSAAVTRRKRNIGNQDVGQASAVMPALAIPSERRCKARKDYRCLCSYEAIETVDEKFSVITQGKAFALNWSTEGMLLFMALAPHAKQLIVVYTPRSGWGRTAHVFEVRWTKPVPVESFGNLCLVGCRQIFGPSYHLSF